VTLLPQAAYYGLGAVFPVVVLDPQPAWHQPVPGALPERSAQAHEVLALRWCGPGDADDAALDTLRHAASQAPSPPHAELAAFRDRLPAGLRLIALRQTALIGPWSKRPGRTTPPA
jgi:hypothetical protein